MSSTNMYENYTTLSSRKDYTQALMPDGTIILEGVTTTCPNCKAIAPKISLLQKKYPDAKWYVYNVDEAEDIAQELGARQVPHFSVFRDGMLEDGVTGAKPQDLERAIKGAYDGKVVEE